jgi:triacylglycerol esterase/lipase EstA (alpha/beta hydrolase family)
MALLARLSPRRRLLVFVTAFVVVVVVAAGSVGAIMARRHEPAGLPTQSRPGPVLLVPGYGGSQVALSQLADRIRATGRTATVLTLPDGGVGDLAKQADAVDAAVRAAVAVGAPSVDLIGYSAGGVVVRLWVARHDGVHLARRVVTLGSPLHGAQIAAVGSVVVPGACPVACQQLVPGSALLTKLDGERLPSHLPWLSIWTEGDETVTPPDSARLTGAVNVPLQSVCPDVRVSHGELPTDPLVTTLVLAALSTAPLSAPAPGTCG